MATEILSTKDEDMETGYKGLIYAAVAVTILGATTTLPTTPRSNKPLKHGRRSCGIARYWRFVFSNTIPAELVHDEVINCAKGKVSILYTECVWVDFVGDCAVA